MNKEEARQILQGELEAFRVKSHAELVKLIDAEPIAGERASPSGKWYQIEIQVFWDKKPSGDIRVIGSIDVGGLESFVPLTDDFIKSP